jgi:hypothetical protein
MRPRGRLAFATVAGVLLAGAVLLLCTTAVVLSTAARAEGRSREPYYGDEGTIDRALVEETTDIAVDELDTDSDTDADAEVDQDDSEVDDEAEDDAEDDAEDEVDEEADEEAEDDAAAAAEDESELVNGDQLSDEFAADAAALSAADGSMRDDSAAGAAVAIGGAALVEHSAQQKSAVGAGTWAQMLEEARHYQSNAVRHMSLTRLHRPH